MWPTQEIIGYAFFAAALLLLIWGVTVDGKAWWWQLNFRRGEIDALKAKNAALATRAETAEAATEALKLAHQEEVEAAVARLTEAERIAAEHKDDYPRLRIEMDRITDPDREFREAFRDRLAQFDEDGNPKRSK